MEPNCHGQRDAPWPLPHAELSLVTGLMACDARRACNVGDTPPAASPVQDAPRAPMRTFQLANPRTCPGARAPPNLTPPRLHLPSPTPPSWPTLNPKPNPHAPHPSKTPSGLPCPHCPPCRPPKIRVTAWNDQVDLFFGVVQVGSPRGAVTRVAGGGGGAGRAARPGRDDAASATFERRRCRCRVRPTSPDPFSFLSSSLSV